MKEKIFERMCAIVEQPGYPLLKSYKQDLYKIDREILNRTWVQGLRYLWIVRECGTDLAILGMDKRASEEACLYIQRGGDSEMYLIDAAGRLTKIDKATALAFAKTICYKYQDGYIWHYVDKVHHRIASMECKLQYQKGQQHAEVAIGTLDTLTPIDKKAFERLAISEAINMAGSLFISVTSLKIDGVETLVKAEDESKKSPVATDKKIAEKELAEV